ncbi:MAG: hypothetical protein U1E45_22045 [Geminicoccaceae bacterium]
MFRLIACLVTAATVAACSATQSAGNGPVPWSEGLRQAYAEYRARPGQGAFAIALDGSTAGYVYCTQSSSCMGRETTKAIQLCEQHGATCAVYDHRGQIVWNEAPPDDGWDDPVETAAN